MSLLLLPDSIINRILLFNSHPVADMLKIANDNSELEKRVINELQLPKNILLYNKGTFNRIIRDKSISIINDNRQLGFIVSSDQIRLIQCLNYIYNGRYYSRNPQPQPKQYPAIVIDKRSHYCEAIKKNRNKCENRKKEGSKYCGIHKNML